MQCTKIVGSRKKNRARGTDAEDIRGNAQRSAVSVVVHFHWSFSTLRIL